MYIFSSMNYTLSIPILTVSSTVTFFARGGFPLSVACTVRVYVEIRGM